MGKTKDECDVNIIKLLSVCWGNIGACCIKQGDYYRAIEAIKEALKWDPITNKEKYTQRLKYAANKLK